MNGIKDKLNVSTIWFFLFAVLITFTACSTKNKVVNKDINGKVLEEYYTDKKHPDQKTGIYTSYYESGKIKELSNFKNGVQDGKRTLYYESGKLMMVEHYRDGNYEGENISYFEHGGKEIEGVFKDNARQGLWKVYFENPKNALKQEVTFKDNLINGPCKEYYPNGKVAAEGNKVEIGDGIDVFDGNVQVYDTSGILVKRIVYEQGRQISKEEIQ
jgi:uncharacterized protein